MPGKDFPPCPARRSDGSCPALPWCCNLPVLYLELMKSDQNDLAEVDKVHWKERAKRAKEIFEILTFKPDQICIAEVANSR